ncbi:L-2-hydroxyglutarate oxidase [Silvimonas iriomotensis]|uniref:Hydroxyglutarate oxidase n=1 Tax=Silvimonas iriomotensis TaxID=449662 RepID=A0ABQ2P484_9NEIS|nr:L-2-hydroxyglutarate oxidase [Silvimonas iriomotensis]GGP17831.1 hydroxyglutarate oxidase [Silvimonas iriomotensis]
MSSTVFDFVIVGGGIVGLSSAVALQARFPQARIVVLEKENALAQHQTGHNSGVIHSGIYYKPGSFKARFARAGNQSMVAFCREHEIEHELCGKVIVATQENQLAQLEKLFQRGLDNQLEVERIGPERLQEIEPHVRGLGAIRVPSAGIVNYRQVCLKYAELITAGGGEIRLGAAVRKVREKADELEIITANEEVIRGRFMVNCAGLHSDRVAKLGGVNAGMQIVPFRGEYFEIKPERRHLVKHLIYPVPDPAFPFLGVHYTRMIGGHVEAGPNAVLAFAREGYNKTDFRLGDLAEVMTYPGFWKLSARYWREGAQEMIRSWSKAAFVRSLQQLIPEISADDLVPAPAGIRAQGLKANGELVDDFQIVPGHRSIHVCNAPSPAATASIEIGRYVAGCVPA